MNNKRKEEIRNKILENLNDYGLFWNNNELRVSNGKKSQLKLSKYANNFKNSKSAIENYIAQPYEINPLKVEPYLQIVNAKDKKDKVLWNYAKSMWSIPVTNGYGRRIRYFVFDKQNNKLIGVVGLSDPIIGLNIRDKISIGWNKDQKINKLYNCMTAYILGAIPPYNSILGGKLVALTLMFPEVRKLFYKKYKKSAREKNKQPYLTYIDTMGAFGKSSIYNRLLNWEFVGYTKGNSHIHITMNGSWDLINQVVPKEVFKTYNFGQGPNWKMRILKHALKELDLPTTITSNGWERGYYRLTLIHNWKDYLLNKTNKIHYKDFKRNELVDYWKNRWVIPRLEKLNKKLFL